jgi:FAD dependent oxidoreductase
MMTAPQVSGDRTRDRNRLSLNPAFTKSANQMIEKPLALLCVGLVSVELGYFSAVIAAETKPVDRTIGCDIMVAGGGLSGMATAYEGLLAGKQVCMTEITDWVGGQISAQGVSALDERPTQRAKKYFPRGYLEFRQKVQDYYGKLNSGYCWVSEACFLPKDAHKLLYGMLKTAESKGRGKLYWYPNTVVKETIVGKRSSTNPNRERHHSIPSRYRKRSKIVIATKIRPDFKSAKLSSFPLIKLPNSKQPNLPTGMSSMPLKPEN